MEHVYVYEIEFTEYSKSRPYFWKSQFCGKSQKTQNADPGKSEISHLFYQYEMQVLWLLSTFLEIAFTKHNIFKVISVFFISHANPHAKMNKNGWQFFAFLQFCKRSLLLKQKGSVSWKMTQEKTRYVNDKNFSKMFEVYNFRNKTFKNRELNSYLKKFALN